MMKISWAELSWVQRELCVGAERNFVLATNEQSNDDLKSFSFSNFFTHTSWKSSAQPTMLSSLSPVARNLRYATVSQWVTAKGKARSDRERLMDFRGVSWEFQEFRCWVLDFFKSFWELCHRDVALRWWKITRWHGSCSIPIHGIEINPSQFSVDTTTITFHR